MSINRKRAGALVRVSSEEQAKGGYGLEFQEQDIRVFCERNALELVHIFRDEGYSGASQNRPGFREMMEWAREKRFDVLVVWKLDRLFRDTKLTLQTIDELASLGIEFRSVHETFTHDSNGRFLLTIFAAGAEKERKDIALRMSAGRIASARRGTWITPSMPPFGYRYNPETKRLEIDQQEADIVKKLFSWLVEERQSLYKIQCRLNQAGIPTKFDRMGRKKRTGTSGWWSKRTIGRILTNEVYGGTFTFRKYLRGNRARTGPNLRPEDEWVTVTTPVVVSREVLLQAQAQLAENAKKSPRRTKELYLLRGLLICGHDGRRMQAARRKSDRDRICKYYFCSGIRKEFAAVRCLSHSVSESRMAPPIWEKLKQLLLNPATAFSELADFQNHKIRKAEFEDKQKSLTARRKKTSESERRLAELYVSQAVDKTFYQAEHQRLKENLAEIDRELQRLEGLVTTQEEMSSRARTIESLYARYEDRLNNASDELKREILNIFVKSVVVRDGSLEMEVALPSVDPFAGQQTHLLSRKTTSDRHAAEHDVRASPRKETFTVFLRTTIVPKGEIFRKAEIYRNFEGSNAHKQHQ